MNIPQLRFPEFQGEWEKKKLGEVILSIESGTSVNSIDQPILNKLQYGILKTSCISKGEFFPNENKKIIDSEISKSTLNPVRDSILVSRMNTPQLVGENGYIDQDYPNLFTPDRLWLLKTLPNYSAKFLNYILTTSYIRSTISNIATGTSNSMKNISQPNFLSIESYFPTKPEQNEQTKIASFLTAVDEKIQSLKKKHHLLEQYKKGVMQKLFSQELRFKDECGNDFPEWKVRKLGEIAKITTGSSNRQDSNLDGKYTFFDRSIDIRTSDRFLFDAEAIIVPGEGQEFIPKYFIGKFDLHQRTYAIMDFKNANGLFLYYSISFNTNHLNSQAVGSTVKSLRLPMFETMPIYIPCIEEQTAIANFLFGLDEKINQTQRQIEKTEMWKKGLLQKMFC